MFDSKIYRQRRERLKKQIKSGLILFLGNEESPMNYPSNVYPFRQDSSFLYFFGLDTPGLAAVINVDADKEILFGDDISVEDIVWMGDVPSVKNRARQAGIRHTSPSKDLEDILKAALRQGKKVHYFPPYRMITALKIEKFLGIHHGSAKDYCSKDLIKAVVAQRSVKIKEEIEEMEKPTKSLMKCTQQR